MMQAAIHARADCVYDVACELVAACHWDAKWLQDGQGMNSSPSLGANMQQPHNAAILALKTPSPQSDVGHASWGSKMPLHYNAT